MKDIAFFACIAAIAFALSYFGPDEEAAREYRLDKAASQMCAVWSRNGNEVTCYEMSKGEVK